VSSFACPVGDRHQTLRANSTRPLGRYLPWPSHVRPPAQGLTVMVTGATEVSGYNMVKGLAEPAHWAKIYYLSSRPLQASFFLDLGAGAGKVTHLAVEFLSEPSIITQALSVIKSVQGSPHTSTTPTSPIFKYEPPP